MRRKKWYVRAAALLMAVMMAFPPVTMPDTVYGAESGISSVVLEQTIEDTMEDTVEMNGQAASETFESSEAAESVIETAMTEEETESETYTEPAETSESESAELETTEEGDKPESKIDETTQAEEETEATTQAESETSEEIPETEETTAESSPETEEETTEEETEELEVVLPEELSELDELIELDGSKVGSYSKNLNVATLQIFGLSPEELYACVDDCISDRNSSRFNYKMVVDEPVYDGGTRYDCSTFICDLYNNYIIPYAKKKANAITDEKGRELTDWGYYSYQSADENHHINNCYSLRNKVGKAWSKKKVQKLYDNVEDYLNDGGDINTDLLPNPGDLLLYGHKSGSTYYVDHVGMYLGEYKGEGKGYWMAECTTSGNRSKMNMKKSETVGNWNGAAINRFWVHGYKGTEQTLFWVKSLIKSYDGNVSIIKTDALTGERISGAKFVAYEYDTDSKTYPTDDEDEGIELEVTGSGNSLRYVFPENIDITSKEVKKGHKKFRIVEEEAPEGYSIGNPGYVDVDLIADGTLNESTFTYDVPEIVVENPPDDNGVKIRVRKVTSTASDAYAAIVKNNSMYELKDSIYGVYDTEAKATAAGDDYITTLKIKSNGYSSYFLLPETFAIGDTVYIRELSAGSGYQLDRTVYSLELEKKKNTKTLEDVPLVIGVELEKYDASTEDGTPENGLDLSNIQFSMDYYDDDGLTSFEQIENDEAERRTNWRIKTIKETIAGKDHYIARLDDEHQVNNTPLYKVGDKYVVPLGTLAITEVEGDPNADYNTEDMFWTFDGVVIPGANTVVNISEGVRENGTKYVSIKMGQHSKISDDLELDVSDYPRFGRLEIEKFITENKQLIAGAKFQLLQNGNVVRPNENNGIYGDIDANGTITVQANGYAYVTHVPKGAYELKEIYSPVGYKSWYTLETISIKGGRNRQAKGNEPFYVPASVQKVDSETGKSSPQGGAKFEGAVFEIIANENIDNQFDLSYTKGQIVATLTLNAEGYAKTTLSASNRKDVLTEGKYLLHEKTAPEGYIPMADTPFEVTKDDADKTFEISFPNAPKRGGVKIRKTDNDLKKSREQGDAKIAGAKYAIINKNANPVLVDGTLYESNAVVKTITTDANGVAQTGSRTLPYGTYEIKETDPSTGYLLNNSWSQSLKINEDGKIVDLTASPCPEPVIRGGVKISKQDNDSKKANPQGDAELSKAQYAIINNSAKPVCVDKDGDGKFETEVAVGDVALTITTDANGIAQTDAHALPYGSYTIKETDPSTGYLLNSSWSASFSVRTDGEVIDLTGKPCYEKVERGAVKVLKRDRELNKNHPLGGAKLSGAKFDIINRSKESVFVDKDGDEVYETEIAVGAVAFTIVSDGTGLAQTNDRALPYGTYELVEVEAPEGYLQPDEYPELSYTRSFKIRKDGEVIDLTDNDGSIRDQVIRNDFTLRKISSSGQKGMANIPFRVTSMTTGESHIVMTDANGRYSSAKVKHSVNTNAGDETNGDPACGLWFALDPIDGTTAAVDDKLGALPYDTYHIEELECEANAGMTMWEDVFTIDEDHVYQGAVILDLSNIENERKPSIGTQASAASGSQYADADGIVTLTDTVTYNRLEEGTKYILRTKLYNKSTEVFVRDSSGNELVFEKPFTVNTMFGTVKASVTFNAKGLEGADVVFFEEVVPADKPDEEPVAEHKDPEDEDQTIHFCSIGTTAHAEGSDINLIPSKGEVNVVDTVAYHNLQQGVKYTLSGILMDKESKEEVKVNGKAVTAERTFVANEASGTVDVRFTFDSTGLGGRDLVVFETLSLENRDLAVHEDIEDESQTIHVTEVKTNAYNEKTEEQVSKVVDELVIIDRVTYKNLIPGKEYTVSGVMRDKETGEEIKNASGESVTASMTFTAEEADGEVLLPFTFKGVTLAGRKIVACETLYYEWTEVAVHADLNDEDQTTWIPELKTTALDKATKTNNVMAGKDAVITDIVTYSDVKPGVRYTVTGKLMNPKTGEPLLVNGKEITGQSTFTPEVENGAVEVEFRFDAAELAGTTAVVYESLYCDGDLVAEHNDPTDAEQTVYIPGIGTNAADKENGTHFSVADKSITVVDTVTYKGLDPETEYTLTGFLMNKADGRPVRNGDGKEVTVKKKFTPEASDGSVDIEFTFDGRTLAGTTAVVYESLYLKDKLVAEHKNPEDEDQTIRIPEIGTSALDKATKSKNLLAGKDAVIVDTVTYSNLKPGIEYVVTGKLMDPATKKPITVSGCEVTGQTTFTPEKESGAVEVEFRFDASGLEGMTAVVYENLYVEGTLIGSHEDINDEEQSIFIPEIRTTAKDKETNDHNGLRRETITIIDTVTYSNLIPGEAYTVSGTLMDKDTGKAFMEDGKAVVSKPLTFTPEASFGTVDITFTFKGVSLKSTALVAFETLTYKNQAVAVHADITDEDQTVYYPEIGTTAKDKKTGEHIGAAAEKVTVVDTVVYRGLTPYKKYVVKGTLMDKETGKVLKDPSGKEVTASKKFTPQSADGSVELEFKFDGSLLAGKTVVAFESVTYKDKEVAVHADLSDENQTVYYPEIGTKARDKADGDQVIPASGKVTITDTVSYKNLAAGKKYTVIGTLMDKDTGKAATIGDKPVVSDPVTFKPEKSEGTVEIAFTFDASKISGKTLVVFEEMYVGSKIKADDEDKDDKKVAEHKDLEDKEQTVTVEKPDTPDRPGNPSNPSNPSPNRSTPKTGDESHVVFYLGVMLAAFAGVIGMIVFRRKKGR